MEDWERQARRDALEGIRVRVRSLDARRLAELLPKPTPPAAPEPKDDSHLEQLAALIPPAPEKE